VVEQVLGRAVPADAVLPATSKDYVEFVRRLGMDMAYVAVRGNWGAGSNWMLKEGRFTLTDDQDSRGLEEDRRPGRR